MDIISCAQEKDIFKKFLMQLIIHKSFEENIFFSLEQVKSFEQIKVTYTPMISIPFQNAQYNGVKITFSKLFPKSTGLHRKTLVFIFPFTGGTHATKHSNISRLMQSLGCKSLTKNYISIRNELERLATGRKSEQFKSTSTDKTRYMSLSTPMMLDMANGRLVYKKGLVEIGWLYIKKG